jgi:hypothetical protein
MNSINQLIQSSIKPVRNNNTAHHSAVRKLYTLIIEIIAILVLSTSCSLLSGGIRTSRESDENIKKQIQEKGIYIYSITVNKSFDSETVKKNAAYIFDILITASSETSKKGFKTDAVLKEESFVKGFQQLNTVTLELIVMDKNKNAVKFVLISEESENTLSSYKYLYKILEKGIKETGL